MLYIKEKIVEGRKEDRGARVEGEGGMKKENQRCGKKGKCLKVGRHNL